jgi:hypothetical protein
LWVLTTSLLFSSDTHYDHQLVHQSYPDKKDPDKDQASGTASLKMGITELSSPLPPTKDYRKQRMQRAKV